MYIYLYMYYMYIFTRTRTNMHYPYESMNRYTSVYHVLYKLLCIVYVYLYLYAIWSDQERARQKGEHQAR